MKAIKGLVLFAGLGIMISSCFNPPEFSIEPVIKLDDIYLGIPTDQSKFDSLVIKLAFKDGDGDLGLESSPDENPSHFIYPFNLTNFYLVNSGQIIKIASAPTNIVGDRPYKIIDDLDKTGKLVTKRTVDRNSFTGVPPYSPSSCSYQRDTVYIVMQDADLVDHSTLNVIDTISDIIQNTPLSFMIAVDTFYIEQNPNFQNITIEFWKQPVNGGPLEQVQFGPPCLPAFDTRFPVLSDKGEGTPLEGVLTYSLYTNAIRQDLLFNFFMLKIRIQDRGLHPSNLIETKMYSIDQLVR